MKNLTDDPTYAAAVRCPEDGDTGEGATWEAGYQDLANRTAALKQNLDGAFSGVAIPLGLWTAAGPNSGMYLVDTCWEAIDAAGVQAIRIPIKGVRNVPAGKLNSFVLRYSTDNEYVSGDATLTIRSQDSTGAFTVHETLSMAKHTAATDVTVAVSPTLDLSGDDDVYAFIITADLGSSKSLLLYSARVSGDA